MSIQRMIALHPHALGADQETLGTVAHHAMLCAALCTSCADACLAEPMDMTQCIRLCLDCADVCAATARLATRRTGHNRDSVRLMLKSCARVCTLCADECARHAEPHCQLCAEMCRTCAADCEAALSAVG